jgi:hypothetical protein
VLGDALTEFEPGWLTCVLAQAVREMRSTLLLVVGRGLRGEEERFLALPRQAGDDELRARLGRRARERVTEQFSWHKLGVVVERAYSG